MSTKVGIIGLGTVGEAVIRSLKKYAALIARRTAFQIEIKKVCDTNRAKKNLAKKFSLAFTVDPFELIRDSNIDVIVELIGGIEPAYTIITESLKQGKSVVTANKALLAERGSQIFSLAKRKKRRIGFEASVCGAIPLIKSISEGLIGCEVKKIYGILNGTTNYILDKMTKKKIDFDVSLKEAQTKGIAERKLSLDIQGIDTLHKLCILSYLSYGIWPPFGRVYTEGIARICLLDIIYAEELNYRIKLLAIAKKESEGIDLRIHPTLVPLEHPLSQVASTFNAVYLDTYPAGELLFYGQGAGGIPTSSSVISDIVSIASGTGGFIRNQERVRIKNIKDIKIRYYIRFMAADQPGVLAKISKILASFKISIASVTQKERKKGKFVPIVMLTHEAREESVRKALCSIDGLSVIRSPSQIIRIEDL